MKNNTLTAICIGFLSIGIIGSCASSKNSSMNNMVAIAVGLYLLSKVYGLESLEAKIILKLGTLAVFYLILRYFKIYSLRDMKDFIQSQFKPNV